MAIKDSATTHFIPRGLSDSLDQFNSFEGSCQAISNMIFDRTDSNALTSRPGAFSITTFTGFNTPGVISTLKQVGPLIYGMIGSALNAGNDQPFIYNVTTNAFLTISNITAANTPATQSSAGDWTTPSMDIVGTKIMVTHPGFNAVGGYYIGWFDISGFSSAGLSGTTNGTTTITITGGLGSSNLNAYGIQVGFAISGSSGDIPAGTYITNINALNGTSAIITLSQAATGSHTGQTLTITGGTLSNPLWGAGNLSGALSFTTLPTVVAQFYNRAYYGSGNNVLFSDSLVATNATASTQVLTLGDTTAILAMKGLPYTTTQSGILQSLMVFKSGAIWAITGDAASTVNPLSLNSVSEETTNIMPLSIDIAPEGIVFVDSSGPRLIDHSGTVRFLTDQTGNSRVPDLINPFSACTRITRANGAYCNSVYRICLDTIVNGQTFTGDYWYDFTKGRWTGPHTFVYHQIIAYSNYFLIASNNVNGTLFQSNVVQASSSVFTELTLPYQFSITTAFMPMTGRMNMQQIVESTMEIGIYGTNTTYNISLYDEYNNQTTGTPIVAVSNQPQWGSVTWGSFTWAQSLYYCVPKLMNWSNPFVFNKCYLTINGTAVTGSKIKNVFFRYQDAGYTATS